MVTKAEFELDIGVNKAMSDVIIFSAVGTVNGSVHRLAETGIWDKVKDEVSIKIFEVVEANLVRVLG